MGTSTDKPRRGSELLIGWREIADYLCLAESTVRLQKKELFERGIVFWRRNRHHKKIVVGWAEDLRGWKR